MKNKPQNEFERVAAEQNRTGFISELWGFLKHNKKWWLIPIIVCLLAFSVLILLSGTGIAPFIYTLF